MESSICTPYFHPPRRPVVRLPRRRMHDAKTGRHCVSLKCLLRTTLAGRPLYCFSIIKVEVLHSFRRCTSRASGKNGRDDIFSVMRNAQLSNLTRRTSILNVNNFRFSISLRIDPNHDILPTDTRCTTRSSLSRSFFRSESSCKPSCHCLCFARDGKARGEAGRSRSL